MSRLPALPGLVGGYNKHWQPHRGTVTAQDVQLELPDEWQSPHLNTQFQGRSIAHVQYRYTSPLLRKLQEVMKSLYIHQGIHHLQIFKGGRRVFTLLGCCQIPVVYTDALSSSYW